MFYITKEDFSCGDSKKRDKSLKICKPGTYKLKEDISFCPKKNDIAAIVIDSDNVVLDLNGKTLKQSNASKLDKITGILVVTGHENITILGNYGSILNFSQRGIYVQGNNKYITIGDETSLRINGCGYGTEILFFDGEKGLVQAGLQLGDQEFTAFFGIGKFYGILDQVKVRNLIVSENSCGIVLGEGSDFLFENCDVSGNTNNRLIWKGFTDLGFFIPNSVVCYGLVYFSNPNLTPPPNFGIDNIKFENCRFNSNLADATVKNADGAYCDAFIMAVNFSNLKIKNCQFNSNSALLGTSSLFSQTRGLVLGSGYATVIEDSEFCSNEAGNYVSGFNLSGLIASSGQEPNNFQSKSTSIKNCMASGNSCSPSLISQTVYPDFDVPGISAIGFQIRYPEGLTLEDCVAENNSVTLLSGHPFSPDEPETAALADGISVYSDIKFPLKFSNNIKVNNAKLSKNRVLYDCSDIYNQSKVFASSSGLRIYDDLCENIVIENSVITNNLPGISESPYPLCENYSSAGIDLFNLGEKTGPSYVTITDSKIQSNGSFGVFSNLDLTTIKSNVISYQDIGIELNSCNNTVMSNTFLLNGIAVKDETNPSTTVVYDNTATTNNSTGSSYQVFGGFLSNNVEIANIPSCPPVKSRKTEMLKFDVSKHLEIKKKVFSIKKK